MPLGEWRRRVWYLLNRGRFEAALWRELEDHRALTADARRFGNTLRLREQAQDVWGWSWLDDLERDVRFAWRMLVRSPAFTLLAISSLALAIAATTAIFTLVHAVLLQPLPFHEPERLVQVSGSDPRSIDTSIGWRDLDAFRQQSTAFEAFTAYQPTTRHLQHNGTQRVTAVMTDSEFFSLLGVDAGIGRTYRPGDHTDVAVISAGLWQRQFGSDPALPGRSMALDGRTVTVLGVMPPSFQFPYGAASLMPGVSPESRTDVWVPYQAQPRGRASFVVGRLKRGVPIEFAAAELRVLAGNLERLDPEHNTGAGVRLEALIDAAVGPVRGSLWMMFAVAGLVLAAACANVMNLVLARMTSRMQEVTTRIALGASPLGLMRQFLVENLLVSIAAGAAGALLAAWGTSTFVAIGSTRIPRSHEVGVDWATFAFLLAICPITTLLPGLAPVVGVARAGAQQATIWRHHATADRRFRRLRDGLVVLEVALAFILMFGAAAIMREVMRLQGVGTGMRTSNVLTLHLSPRAPAADYAAIERRVAQLAGVEAAGFTQLVPLQNWGWEAGFSIQGRASANPAELPIAGLRSVTSGYFRALGIPVVRGRGFNDADTANAQRVVLVNEALVRRYFPGKEAVGRLLDRGTIVGVVGDVRQVRLNRAPEPEIYSAVAQNAMMTSDLGMSLVVRTSGPPEPYTSAIRAAVREENANLAVFNVRTMDQVLADSLWQLRLYRWLIGLFGILVLIVASIGLYGVMSCNVAARMREFAVRLALGSHPAALARLIVTRGLGLVGAGIVTGIMMAVALAPIASALEIRAIAQPTTIALTCTLLFVIALVACAIPARRVAAVNPATVLRHDR